ncbi:MAG: hypothetical protein QOE00_385 [Ilumatobacteraceae bacterium]
MMSSGPGSRPIRGVLFDFGYTLFAHATLAATIGELAGQLGAELPTEQAVALAGRIDAAAMDPAELLHPRDYDSTVWAERWRLLYSAADEVVLGLGNALFTSMHDPLAWVPYRDAAAVLAELHSHSIAIGIVSNTGWDVRTVFAAHGLSTMVTSFTLSYEVGVVKPDRRIFVTACEAIAVEPEDVLMVGDDPRSDGGSVDAGIRALLLPPRRHGSDNGLRSVLDLVVGDAAR